MKAILIANGRPKFGGSALICHNERLMDPLDDIVRSLSGFTAKRKKTEADHMEIARLEFLGGLYTNGNGPCLPSWNVLRCLQEGAKRHKRGADVLRGVYPQGEHVDLWYEGDGVRDPEEMWRTGTYHIRKSVGVQRSRVMRTRPLFTDWKFELPVEVDGTIFDKHTVEQIWKESGVYVGLGDMRPVYGRFQGTVRWDE